MPYAAAISRAQMEAMGFEHQYTGEAVEDLYRNNQKCAECERKRRICVVKTMRNTYVDGAYASGSCVPCAGTTTCDMATRGAGYVWEPDGTGGYRKLFRSEAGQRQNRKYRTPEMRWGRIRGKTHIPAATKESESKRKSARTAKCSMSSDLSSEDGQFVASISTRPIGPSAPPVYSGYQWRDAVNGNDNEAEDDNGSSEEGYTSLESEEGSGPAITEPQNGSGTMTTSIRLHIRKTPPDPEPEPAPPKRTKAWPKWSSLGKGRMDEMDVMKEALRTSEEANAAHLKTIGDLRATLAKERVEARENAEMLAFYQSQRDDVLMEDGKEDEKVVGSASPSEATSSSPV